MEFLRQKISQNSWGTQMSVSLSREIHYSFPICMNILWHLLQMYTCNLYLTGYVWGGE